MWLVDRKKAGWKVLRKGAGNGAVNRRLIIKGFTDLPKEFSQFTLPAWPVWMGLPFMSEASWFEFSVSTV